MAEDVASRADGVLNQFEAEFARSTGNAYCKRLLQAIDGVHHALKLRPIDQIEGAFFARKHFERDTARGGNHSCGFFGRQIASRNRVEREVDEDTQAANAPAFFVDLLLSGCRSTLLNRFHDWARGGW